MRRYYEHFNHDLQPIYARQQVIGAPAAYLISPKELVFLPHSVVEQRTNLVRWTVIDAGGNGSYSFWNPGTLNGQYGYQFLVGDAAATFLGSTNDVTF